MTDTNDTLDKEPYQAPLDATDVYLVLLNKLETASEKLQYYAKEAENAQNSQFGSASGANSVAPDKLPEFKEKVLEMMSKQLESDDSLGDCCLDLYLESRVKESLKEHISRQRTAIAAMEKNLELTRKSRELITARTRDLEVSLAETAAQEKLPKVNSEKEEKKREQAVDTKHRELIKAVRAVTNFAVGGGSKTFQDILGALLDKWFTPDPYIVEERSWSESVEFLLRTGMVVRHPDNCKLIRLVDFT